MKTTIIGNGVWGNALYSLIKTNNQSVVFWDKKTEIIDSDIIILSVPTQSIRSILKKVTFTKKGIIIVNTSKGIERDTHKLPYEIISEFLGNHLHYLTLNGPSFAQEVKEKMPTLVNLGYLKKENVNKIKNIFQTDFFRVKPVKGVKVLELAGAFKNVYAIACGLSDGLGFGINTRTKLITIAIEEFHRLNKKMKNNISLKMSPGTIGDLILTCSSTKSRNFNFGKMLATCKVNEALNTGKTIEGYYTVSSISYFANKNRIHLPLAKLIEKIIVSDNPKTARKFFLDFIKST